MNDCKRSVKRIDTPTESIKWVNDSGKSAPLPIRPASTRNLTSILW